MCSSSFKVQLFNVIFLPLAGFIRKCYSPIIYWILYLFVFRKVLKKYHAEHGPNELSDLKSISATHFINKIMKHQRWISEKHEGAIDFTYGNPEFFLIPEIYNKWGRDCDDFSHLSFEFLKAKGYKEVYQILTTTVKCGFIFKHSHLFTVGRRNKDEQYVVYNVNNVYSESGIDLTEVVCKALKRSNEKRGDDYTPAAWCIYRSL
jgi:hypothetical protein